MESHTILMLAALAYIWFGYWMGGYGWELFREEDKRETFLFILFFPASSYSEEMYADIRWSALAEDGPPVRVLDRHSYACFIAFMWPTKVIWLIGYVVTWLICFRVLRSFFGLLERITFPKPPAIRTK